MMRAAVVSKYGPPEGLEIKELPKPTPEENEILIQIRAATVTFGDAMLRSFGGVRRLVFGLFFSLKTGKILGHELAGEIESVGDQVTRFNVGDHIFGSTGTNGGAHAEYICLPEDAYLALKPPNLSFEEAAAVPVGANTALDILKPANIQDGQSVLVYGASGSVGTYAVQLTRHFGADVTGVCSGANAQLVRSIGASNVIDYTTEDFTKSAGNYDFIFDAVGKISESKVKRLLRPSGSFLTVSTPTKEEPEHLAFLVKLLESGELKPVIDRRYALDQIVEAHRYVDQGHKKGNVAIFVSNGGVAGH